MPLVLLIAGGLTLASASAVAFESAPSARAQAQPIEAILLRPEGVDAAALLDALQLRSPQRTLAIPPWPSRPSERFELFAVASVRHEGTALEITVVLSDGRAYYRTLQAEADPRVAASTVANLVAAIEEDALPPDEEDVPLPPEQVEPEPEPEPKPEPAVAVEPVLEPEPEPEPELPGPPPRPLELESILAGTGTVALGPPTPGGFGGGGATGGLELRWPGGALVSLAVRSQWHQPQPLTVGRTRISVGGGHAWRRGRVELRTVAAIDVEPWGVRRASTRQEVAYPDGQRRALGVQLGAHLRLVPSLRLALGPRLHARVGPRLEVAGSMLAQAAGVARLVVADQPSGEPVARVGGLELSAGLELGLAWDLPPRRAPKRRRGP